MSKSTIVVWDIMLTGAVTGKHTQIHIFNDSQDVIEYFKTTDVRLLREHGAIPYVFHGEARVTYSGEKDMALNDVLHAAYQHHGECRCGSRGVLRLPDLSDRSEAIRASYISCDECFAQTWAGAE
jgi:hypothetical protein